MNKGDFKNRIPVATIHTHFNIFRDSHAPLTGPVTLEEQIAALERHVRWHERQTEIGKALLARLKKHPPKGVSDEPE